MEDIRDILRIPNQEVLAVTKVLTGLDLEKTDSNQCTQEKILTVMIHTKGFFLANIKCEMDWEMFEQILSGMYGGEMPPEEECSLYMNEYMNIVCGRIVSKVNTLTDSVSKLSVPEYFGENDPDFGRDEQAYHILLAYRYGQGFLRFIIQFEFQQNGGEEI
mgnify:FL=1